MFISELQNNKQILSDSYKPRKPHPVMFQTVVWDALKGNIGEISTNNSLMIVELYHQLEYLHKNTYEDMSYDDTKPIRRMANEVIDKIDQWTKRVIVFYNGHEIVLDLPPHIQEKIGTLVKETE